MTFIRRNFWKAAWFVLASVAVAVIAFQFRYEVSVTNEKTWIRYDGWRSIVMVCHVPYGMSYAMNFAGDANSVQCKEADIKERPLGDKFYEKDQLVCSLLSKHNRYCEKD
jgi:hypothetical protein